MKGNKPRIAVAGSSNTDMVVRADHLPSPGETVLGGVFTMSAGGKGANQAVAAARLGADVVFIGRIGTDVFGDNTVRDLTAEGIDTQFLFRDPQMPSGVALIGIAEEGGENAILVASGANAALSVDDIQLAAAAIRSADILVCQLEVPLSTVQAACEIARSAGVPTVLNPAPAQTLPLALLQSVSVLTPNESEAAALAAPGAITVQETAHGLRKLGVGAVVITLGAAGAFVATEAADTALPPFMPSKIVDTTGAGDCFNGALAVALAEGHKLERAARFANAAASLCVETLGAQPAMPRRAAVDSRLSDQVSSLS